VAAWNSIVQQRILVLGANGFIGRRLLARLCKTDWAQPLAGIRAPTSELANGVERRVVEATDRASLARALQGVDAIVNCVAGSAADIGEGARILFEVAAEIDPMPCVVHLSSMAVYGDAVGLVSETAPLRGNLGPYSSAKVAAERIAADYPYTFVLRPGCVYGPGSTQWSTRFAQWLTSRRLGDLGAQGDGYCNLVHVDDVVETILRCLRKPASHARTFNLSSPDPPTWNEYLTRYGRALKSVPVRRVSRRRLMIEAKLLAPPLKVLEVVLCAAKLPAHYLPPPIPPSLLRLMRQEIRLDVRQVEQELGLRWKPLEQGIEETADWYLQTRQAHSATA
jgi:nucleoside-diphosphate-sugar epimerase